MKITKNNLFQYTAWLLLAILYAPMFIELYARRFKTIDYTHAYFILPVSLWLIWRMRAPLRDLYLENSKPCPFAWAELLLACGLFIVGWRNDYVSVMTFSFILAAWGIFNIFYGKNAARAAWFPFAYLLLMVPPPLGILDAVTMPMRYGVSVAADLFMRSFFYPVTRHGLILYVNGTEIFMGQPCSGFRSLIAMLSLGLAYAYLSNADRRVKAWLAVSIIPLALFGNFLRVTGMCFVTYHMGKDAGERFHDIAGYGVFLLLIAALMWFESYLEKRTKVTHA